MVVGGKFRWVSRVCGPLNPFDRLWFVRCVFLGFLGWFASRCGSSISRVHIECSKMYFSLWLSMVFLQNVLFLWLSMVFLLHLVCLCYFIVLCSWQSDFVFKDHYNTPTYRQLRKIIYGCIINVMKIILQIWRVGDALSTHPFHFDTVCTRKWHD